jgi:tRNA-specific 2-thiouridylase
MAGMEIPSNKKQMVFVALSGGVDSAVATALLVEQGYDITGVFMKNWSGDEYGIQTDCPWKKDQEDAEAVCKKLNIPFMSYNFEKEYKQKVVEYFFSEYKSGRTPNPDVMCNKEIKFGIFLKKAIEMGANMIATGHYARVKQNKNSKGYELLKGVDSNKDQSYFLCDLTQEQLKYSIFPIGEYTKPQIRILAEKYGLSVADKPDSQGICFVGEINVAKFLRSNIKIHQGNILDIDSKQIVGLHDGIEFYTIGQREGLHIGGAKEPYFVVRKNKEENIIYVAMGVDNPLLYSHKVEFCDLHLINSIENIDMANLSACIRYRGKAEKGVLDIENMTFLFEKPQRAITEGQKIVIYEGEILRASATIK